MTILAVDTATKSCSAAVVSASGLLAEIILANDQTHAKHLMPLVDQVLALAGIGLNDLDGLAVTRGPGSFTGLRIGLSSIKGLGQAIGKPIVAVSSLEALATQVGPTPWPIFALINAYRNEVYLAAYDYKNGQLIRTVDETVVAPEKIVAIVREPTIFVGSGAMVYGRLLADGLGDKAHLAHLPDHTIRAGTIGQMAVARLESDGCDATDLNAAYLRKSDAELNLGKVGAITDK